MEYGLRRFHRRFGTQRSVNVTRKVYRAALFLLVLSLKASVLAAPRLEAQLSQTRIYIGERAQLTVKVSGVENPSVPDLSAIPDCTVRLVDRKNQNMHSVSIVNGRRTATRTLTSLFYFELMPRQTGSVRIHPIQLDGPSGPLTASAGILNVVGIEEQDRVIVTLEATRDSVVVDEPFSVTLAVYVRQLPKPYAHIDPLSPSEPPHISAPFLDGVDDTILNGPTMSSVLGSRLVETSTDAGFSINRFSASRSSFGDPFGMFDDDFGFGGRSGRRKRDRFRLDREATTRNGAPYYKYSLTLPYHPTAPGVQEFGSVALKGQTITGVTPDRTADMQPIYAMAPGIEVRIDTPPQADRPPCFVGAIGTQLVARAELDALTCNVGDPLTLTLTLSGDIRLDALHAPHIERQPNLNRDFRIYANTVHKEESDDRMAFSYTVRPNVPGTLEFPPIKVAFFNTNTRRYETITTQPIPIRANETVRVHDTTIIATGSRNMEIGEESLLDESLFVPAPLMIMSDAPASSALFLPTLHLPLLLAGPAIYFVALLALSIRRRMPRDAARKRRHQAPHRAERELAKATSGEGFMAGATIKFAILNYIADYCGVTAQTITPDEARRHLRTAGGEQQDVEELCRIFERYFNADFSEGHLSQGNPQADASCASNAIRKLDTTIRAKTAPAKHRRTTSTTLAIILILCSGFSAAWASDGVRVQFMNRSARVQILSARTQEGFAKSAQAFAALIDEGQRSGSLFYNYGLALLLTGNKEEARRAFLRAERYLGSTWSIRRNIKLCLADDSRELAPTLPWYRTPLFWHYGLSGSTRITVACIAFFGVWAALLVRLSPRRSWYPLILIPSIAALVTFGTSCLTTIQQESHDNSRSAIVDLNALTAPEAQRTQGGTQ